MARYRGPKQRISRRFGTPIFGNSKSLERRLYAPGQHGLRSGRRKKSDYSIALAEKQKLRYQYGLLEKQFRRYFEEASRQRGITGEILLQLLELRLDNVVFRMGLANTRDAARQFVNHGHALVNGRRVDIPSFRTRAGDEITVKDAQKSQLLAQRALYVTQAHTVPEWVTIDRDNLAGKVMRLPTREEIDPLVNEQLVVELYSR